MKFLDTRTGALLEPASDFVAQQMAHDPNLKPVDEAPKRAPRKRAAKKEA